MSLIKQVDKILKLCISSAVKNRYLKRIAFSEVDFMKTDYTQNSNVLRNLNGTKHLRSTPFLAKSYFSKLNFHNQKLIKIDLTTNNAKLSMLSGKKRVNKISNKKRPLERRNASVHTRSVNKLFTWTIINTNALCCNKKQTEFRHIEKRYYHEFMKDRLRDLQKKKKEENDYNQVETERAEPQSEKSDSLCKMDDVKVTFDSTINTDCVTEIEDTAKAETSTAKCDTECNEESLMSEYSSFFDQLDDTLKEPPENCTIQQSEPLLNSDDDDINEERLAAKTPSGRLSFTTINHLHKKHNSNTNLSNTSTSACSTCTKIPFMDVKEYCTANLKECVSRLNRSRSDSRLLAYYMTNSRNASTGSVNRLHKSYNSNCPDHEAKDHQTVEGFMFADYLSMGIKECATLPDADSKRIKVSFKPNNNGLLDATSKVKSLLKTFDETKIQLNRKPLLPSTNIKIIKDVTVAESSEVDIEKSKPVTQLNVKLHKSVDYVVHLNDANNKFIEYIHWMLLQKKSSHQDDVIKQTKAIEGIKNEPLTENKLYDKEKSQGNILKKGLKISKSINKISENITSLNPNMHLKINLDTNKQLIKKSSNTQTVVKVNKRNQNSLVPIKKLDTSDCKVSSEKKHQIIKGLVELNKNDMKLKTDLDVVIEKLRDFHNDDKKVSNKENDVVQVKSDKSDNSTSTICENNIEFTKEHTHNVQNKECDQQRNVDKPKYVDWRNLYHTTTNVKSVKSKEPRSLKLDDIGTDYHNFRPPQKKKEEIKPASPKNPRQDTSNLNALLNEESNTALSSNNNFITNNKLSNRPLHKNSLLTNKQMGKENTELESKRKNDDWRSNFNIFNRNHEKKKLQTNINTSTKQNQVVFPEKDVPEVSHVQIASAEKNRTNTLTKHFQKRHIVSKTEHKPDSTVDQVSKWKKVKDLKTHIENHKNKQKVTKYDMSKMEKNKMDYDFSIKIQANANFLESAEKIQMSKKLNNVNEEFGLRPDRHVRKQKMMFENFHSQIVNSNELMYKHNSYTDATKISEQKKNISDNDWRQAIRNFTQDDNKIQLNRFSVDQSHSQSNVKRNEMLVKNARPNDNIATDNIEQRKSAILLLVNNQNKNQPSNMRNEQNLLRNILNGEKENEIVKNVQTASNETIDVASNNVTESENANSLTNEPTNETNKESLMTNSNVLGEASTDLNLMSFISDIKNKVYRFFSLISGTNKEASDSDKTFIKKNYAGKITSNLIKVT